jgi:hypothetical protein
MRTLGLLALVVTAGCGNGGGFVDAPTPTGSFTANWAVQDPNGVALACDQVGATIVHVVASSAPLNVVIDEMYPCDQVMAMSQQLPPGIYSVTYELDDPNALKLATAPEQDGIEIDAGGDNVLAQATFVVDDHGGLALTLNTGNAGGNCTGAGITGMTIELTHAASGACAPVTFAISSGGNYTVDCAAPTTAACIENTDQLTVTGVLSGLYIVAVHGFKGTADCYDGSQQIQLPALEQTLNQTVELTATNGAGC